MSIYDDPRTSTPAAVNVNWTFERKYTGDLAEVEAQSFFRARELARVQLGVVDFGLLRLVKSPFFKGNSHGYTEKAA